METSNESTGETLFDLTSYAGDTLANRSAQPGNGKAQTIRDTCGLGFETALAHYDPDMRCWKMFGGISLWGESRLLENLPPSGMTRSGVLFLQPLWVPLTDETASSLLPPPTANDAKNATFPESQRQRDSLIGAIMRQSWPTPTVADAWTDSLESSQVKPGSMHSVTLGRAVQMWPTPRAAMGETRNHTVYSRDKDKPQNLENRVAAVDPSAVGGRLNPTWVEWLMGFPLGWTDLEDSGTPSSPKSPKSSGA